MKRWSWFWKCIGDKNTRSSKMKLKFQREQITKIVFQKQKRKAKVPNFQENAVAFQLRTVRNYVARWKLEWGFCGTLNGSAEGGHKKERKGQNFILNQGHIENWAKSCWLFLQKNPSNSEYGRVTPRSYYSLSTILFNHDNSLVTLNSKWHGQS